MPRKPKHHLQTTQRFDITSAWLLMCGPVSLDCIVLFNQQFCRNLCKVLPECPVEPAAAITPAQQTELAGAVGKRVRGKNRPKTPQEGGDDEDEGEDEDDGESRDLEARGSDDPIPPIPSKRGRGRGRGGRSGRGGTGKGAGRGRSTGKKGEAKSIASPKKPPPTSARKPLQTRSPKKDEPVASGKKAPKAKAKAKARTDGPTKQADVATKSKAKPCKKDNAEPKSKCKSKQKSPEEAEKAAAKSRKSCAYHLAKRNALNAGASEEDAVQLAKEVSCKDSSKGLYH